MSMPPHAAWAYQHRPEPGSREEELLQHYLVRKDWV
jgi:coproporphyrinogen III oxidase